MISDKTVLIGRKTFVLSAPFLVSFSSSVNSPFMGLKEKANDLALEIGASRCGGDLIGLATLFLTKIHIQRKDYLATAR